MGWEQGPDREAKILALKTALHAFLTKAIFKAFF